MRGLKILGNKKVEISDLPDPIPQEGDVVVKVTASGLCGSELKAYQREQALPTNGGHEVAGIIEDPNGHTQFSRGDRVGVFTIQGCGKCRWCKQGKELYCPDVSVPKGAHAEYVISRASSVIKLDDLDMGLSDQLAVLLFGDGMGVPYGASTRAKVGRDDVTCIFGCGPVGLGMVIVQSFLGAKVLAVDVNPIRLKMASKFGASSTVLWDSQEIVSNLKDLTDGIGPNKCFEAAGRQDTLDVALKATSPGGLITLAGHGKQNIDPQELIAFRNLTLMGNWVYQPSEYKQLLAMQKCGLRAERLITAVYELMDAPKAYREALEGLHAKIMFKDHGKC